MIRTLRKRHLQIWLVLAVLLPLGTISAILVRPKPIIGVLLQPTSTEPLPVVIKTVEKENYVVRLRGNDQSATQLEWVNKNTLIFPTATIYKVHGTFSPGNDDLIGRIEARGTYRFNLKPDPENRYHFIVYDFILQRKIDSINF